MRPFDRFASQAESIGAEVLLERMTHADGVALSLAVQRDDEPIGRWPAMAGDVQLASARLLEPFTGSWIGAVAELDARCSDRGLVLELSPNFLDVHDGDGVPLIRQPAPSGTTESAGAQALAYLNACGWRDGVIMRLCVACECERPVAEFRHPAPGILYALCHRHRGGGGTAAALERIFLGR
jgi:hypothetical protein